MKDKEVQEYLQSLKDSWDPIVRELNGELRHGGGDGEMRKILEFFDVYRSEWTTRDRAFQGYAFSKINEKLKQVK